MLLLFSALPMTALAAEANNSSETGATSGSTGNCNWSYDPDSCVLTISGKGRMYDYVDSWQEIDDETPYSEENLPPWRYYLIKKVVIKKGVTHIGQYAFYLCDELTAVSIAGTVTSIGGGAFAGCTALAKINIPDSVTMLEYGVFSDTAWYDSQPEGVVYIGKNVYGVKGACPAEVNIADGTLGVADGAFSRCESLIHVTVPDSVTSLGYSVFSRCTSLKSAVIGDSVRAIHDGSFYGCTALESVTIGRSVGYIGGGFNDCTSLKRISISDVGAWCGIEFPQNSCNPLCYAHNLFLGDEPITDLVIPDSVTKISAGAFYGCTSVKSVTVPDSVKEIHKYTFCDCSALTSVTLPDSVSMIYDNAFMNCSSLTSIDIPDGVTIINYYTFKDCSSLTSVKLPASVKTIFPYAFEGCSALTDITIPDSVTTIAYYAFLGCSSLKSVTIPASVTKIDSYAFGFYRSSTYYSQLLPSPDFTIFGFKGSAAETYADSYGFTFIPLGDEPEKPYILGDANGNGEIESVDATFIQRCIAQIETPFTKKELMRGDVDGSGDLELLDVTCIQRYLADLKTDYQIGQTVS